MTYRLTLATGPSGEPISTADAKKHCGVSGSDDDTYLDALVVAAREYAEGYLRRSLIDQTWYLYLDGFTSKPIELPRPPLKSVTAITYSDLNGDSQTVDTSVYTVDTDAEPGQIYESFSQVWPATQGIQKAVRIEFVSGYGSAGANVPTPIIHAMKLLVGHWYANRESVTDLSLSEAPQAVDALLRPYQVLTL